MTIRYSKVFDIRYSQVFDTIRYSFWSNIEYIEYRIHTNSNYSMIYRISNIKLFEGWSNNFELFENPNHTTTDHSCPSELSVTVESPIFAQLTVTLWYFSPRCIYKHTIREFLLWNLPHLVPHEQQLYLYSVTGENALSEICHHFATII